MMERKYFGKKKKENRKMEQKDINIRIRKEDGKLFFDSPTLVQIYRIGYSPRNNYDILVKAEDK